MAHSLCIGGLLGTFVAIIIHAVVPKNREVRIGEAQDCKTDEHMGNRKKAHGSAATIIRALRYYTDMEERIAT